MSLAPGARLGSYEIAAAIGAGGMGEVYRARDTKLNREVAIKVLPEALGANPDALARFEREAQAVAALSHPNILAIHDFGTAEIATGGTTATRAYAVTELLEGESLRAKLEQGALPLRKAVEYALQIVHGIAAAHQKGVVHRDLKPENIFVTHDGRVKILDFGLAKTTGAGAEGSLIQTQSAGTSPGTVMGTVGYMSPEQVRGLPVDHRTDIFSFGVVLYEMLSGKRAFRGDSNVETMNAILKEDPPELAVSGSHVPPALDRIVRRCLEKNANERFHSAHDLGLALETLSALTSSASGAAIASTDTPRTKPRLPLWLIAAGAVAIAAAAFFAGHRTAGPATIETPTYHRLTFQRGPIASARYASDGKTIIYSATWSGDEKRLYTTRQESPESLALPYTDADVTGVSSTGELALILNKRVLSGWSRAGTLARASLSGGAPRAVLDDVQDADWLPDGSGFVAARFVDQRYRLEFPLGKTVYETGGYISDVRVSPDGSLVAFADHPVFGDDRGSIAVIDRAGKKRKISRDFSGTQGVAWSHDGSEVWYTGADVGGRALFAATPDGRERAVARAPGNLHLGDIGADGSVLLWQEVVSSGIKARTLGNSEERDLSWLDYSTMPKLSNDGRTLYFGEQGDGAGLDYAVYMRSTDGGPATRLGAGAGYAASPDGKWIFNVGVNGPSAGRFTLLPTGAGDPRPLPGGNIRTHGNAWFIADGTAIVLDGSEGDHKPRDYFLSLTGGDPKPITPEGVTGPPSPDGSVVAFNGKLYPVAGGPPRDIPGWSPNDGILAFAGDSCGLFVRQILGGGKQQVFRIDTVTGRRTLLYDIAPVAGAIPGVWFSLSPDGSHCAYTYNEFQGELFRVTGVR